MNLIDAYVVKVLKVYEAYGKWWVSVEADGWGHISETNLMFNTEHEARQVDIGYLCVI